MNYNDATLRYFETTPGAGALEGPGIATGMAGSRSQGAWIRFDLRFKRDEVEEARFQAFGCPHTIAVASWVAEQAPGRALGSRLPRSVAELSDLFGVPTEKRGRLLVVEDAWSAAMASAQAGR